MAARTSSRRKGSAATVLYPLNEFYAAAGLSLPKYAEIDGAAMLEPYRGLLVHQGDMTPALESYYRQSIHIHLVRADNRRNGYSREVVLRLDGSGRSVEFGAIKIDLELFSKPARDAILEGKLPLGAIMREHKIAHGSRPRAFLQVHSDGLISEALNLKKSTLLYGRRNTLLNPENEPLAEIVEILAPAL